MEFKVKTQSVNEYYDRLVEFQEIMNIWKNNASDREFEITENLKGLTFTIKADKYGEN